MLSHLLTRNQHALFVFIALNQLAGDVGDDRLDGTGEFEGGILWVTVSPN